MSQATTDASVTDLHSPDDPASATVKAGSGSGGSDLVRVSQQGETVADVFGSGDHKAIGRLWIISSFVLALVALGLGIAYGIERLDTADDLFAGDNIVQLFSGYRLVLLFGVVMPLAIGLATYVVPLQVGASSIAFPRAAASAFWGWLISIGLLLGSLAIEGGPEGAAVEGVDLWAWSHIGVIAALGLATICVVTTVLGLRVGGMYLSRVPVFSWSMLVAGAVWLLSLPVLAINLFLIWLDHSHGTIFFGQPVVQYEQIDWVFSQPAIFAAAIPVLGVLADMAPVAASREPRAKGTLFVAIGLFGVLGFGAWAQPFFSGEITERFLFIVVPFALLAVFFGYFGGLIGAALGGKLRGFGPMVGATLGAILIEVGLVIAILRVVDPLELGGTTAQSGLLHAVLLGSFIGLAAGVQYWAPKMFGTSDGSTMLWAGAVLGFVGAALAAVSELIAGFLDQPDGIIVGMLGDAGVTEADTVELLNLLSTVGLGIVGLAAIAFVLAALRLSAGRGSAPDNPWGGYTLEWATTSPPPIGNFPAAPVVTGHAAVSPGAVATVSAGEMSEEWTDGSTVPSEDGAK